MITVVTNYSHTASTSRGYYLRAMFISFRASDHAVTIRGQQLFEDRVYSKKHSTYVLLHVPTLIVLQFSLRKVSLSNAYTNAVSAPDVCGPEVIKFILLEY